MDRPSPTPSRASCPWCGQRRRNGSKREATSVLDDRSAVGDRELRHAVTAAGRHFDPAIGDVVPYRVVDEVRYQSFHQHGVAIGVGALAGVYPAAKAAHLAPAEALRTT